MPSRIAHIRPMLDSISRQTRRPDRVYICIPQRSTREQQVYHVPPWLARADNEWNVRIVRTARDWGPATKLLGVLRAETDPLTRIIVLDDDWEYPATILEVLERAARCASW